MKASVFGSDKYRNRFVVVPQGADPLKVIPDDVKKDLGNLKHFKDIDLPSKPKAVGIDEDQAEADIKKQGYHLSQPKVTVTESVGK